MKQECGYCGRYGHIETECNKIEAEEARKKSDEEETKKICRIPS